MFAGRMKCVPAFLRARNKKCGSPLGSEEIADLIQDTLMALWMKIGTFSGEAKLESWAYRFCVLEMRSALRRKHRRAKHIHEDSTVLPELEAPSEGAWCSHYPAICI